MKRLILFQLAVALVVAGCATNPATGRRQLILMSEAEEIQLGKQTDAEVRKQMGVYNDNGLQQYVERVGRRLTQASKRQNLPWTFTVVDESAVNAFALPGGYIYLTRGIMPFLQNEAEMAAVLGHEIGHVDGRHSAEAYSNQTFAAGGLGVLGIFVPETRPFAEVASVSLGLLFLKHGRNAELEADQLGVRYIASHGWSPQGMPGLLNTLARLDEASGSKRGVPNWMATHPPAADRVERVREAVAAASTSAAGNTTNEADFERQLEGLVYGDSREDGMIRGNEFIHPELRFAVRFPEGWEIMNSSDQVVATRGERSNAAMLLELAPSGGGSPQQTARTVIAKAGFTEVQGQSTRVNGLDAYVGVYEGAVNNSRVQMQAAVIRAGNQTYIVAGLAPPGEYNGVSRAFSTSIQSFRTLSSQEADRIQPDRVEFYMARPGDTWESLARRGSGRIKPATLAIMNGSSPATAPRAGTRLRVVVGD
jgi:predicted Zn-dependent protease